MLGYIYLDINQLENTMSEKEVQIFIDKKEILYSHQNILQTIYAFLPYLTNDDITELGEKCTTMLAHREEGEASSKLEVEKHSWPYPDTKQSVIQEHDMTWGDEYEDTA